MHLAAGGVTMFFYAPLSCGKTLCASELQDRAKVCAGTGEYGGAVKFGKPLTHDRVLYVIFEYGFPALLVGVVI
jgi:hypothetical protein